MSMRDKLLAAANQAAIEATANERGRCLWCLGQVMSELQTKLNTKLLSSVELEAAKMKLRIADAVCMELRRAIVSGVRPAPSGAGGTGQTGPADFSTDKTFAQNVIDRGGKCSINRPIKPIDRGSKCKP